MDIETIRGAVARGWCAPVNSAKVMDTDLAEAISQEVQKVVVAEKEPYLGCATTQQLVDELSARVGVSLATGERWPLYRTVDQQ